ncbi:PAS domain-containing protein [Gemmatimonas sp.]|uniref:PAS domain-containing hybrid sensor histidine kinase/response regulator n=1 Tax=Gemmatimonas sp. TaxID=1962908 RepID=UPI003342BB21
MLRHNEPVRPTESEPVDFLVENMSEGLVRVDRDGVLLECNRAAETILGLPSDQLRGIRVDDPRWGNIRRDGTPLPADEAPVSVVLRTGEPVTEFVHGVRHSSGELRWISVNAAIARNARGEISAAIASFVDITRWHEQERRLQFVIDGSDVGTWDWHVGSGRNDYNARFCEILGRSPSTFSNHVSEWDDLVHPDDKASVWVALNAHLDGKTLSYEAEHRLQRADGTWAWVIGKGKVTARNADGSPHRVSGVILDISHAKDADQMLKRTKVSLEEAQAIAGMGSWEYDAVTHQIQWSQQLFEIFNRNPVEGPPDYAGLLTDYIEADSARLHDAITAAATHGVPYSLVLQTSHANPRVRFVRTEGRVRRNADGKIVGLNGTSTDVTAHMAREAELMAARKEAEEGARQLRELNAVLEEATTRATSLAAQAEQANRAKSEFLANMSHEIRTPLTAILGYADVMREEALAKGSSHESTNAIDTIRRAGEHLLTVINDILDITKIESNKLLIEHVDTDVQRLLRDADSLMRARAVAKGVALRTTLETPVPDRIMSDPTRLRQILLNLIGNAVKFTDAGYIDVRASVMSRDGSSVLRIAIQDTGPGLTPEAVATLFQPFMQADASVTRRHGGSGLGLTICRRLAGLMGGNVTLEHTAPGAGSRFVLELPMVRRADSVLVHSLDAGTKGSADIAPITVSARRLNGRILLAEDGEDNQRLIAFHLRKAGAEVSVVENGVLALDELQRAEQAGQRFDLLLTDMQMPEMDGYTLARAVRQIGSDIGIVALTAHAMAEDRQKCLDAGCDGYATKPIDKEELLSTCATWMDRGRA